MQICFLYIQQQHTEPDCFHPVEQTACIDILLTNPAAVMCRTMCFFIKYIDQSYSLMYTESMSQAAVNIKLCSI